MHIFVSSVAYLKAKALARRSKTALVNTFSWLHD